MKIEIARPFAQITTPARYKVYYGGRGSAKSWTIARVLVTKCAYEKIKVLCAREIQKSIGDSVHALLTEQIEALGLSNLYEITKNSIRGVYSGSEFIYAGLRHNVKEIKSKEGVDICWLEEAAAVSEESWAVLIPTIRKEGSEIWVSFNPDSPDDPTYKRFVINPPPGAIVRKVNWDDNPWFPQVLKAEMEYDRRVDYEKYRHVWEGEPRIMTDALVFKNKFQVETFETPSNAEFMFGADWGFAKDPTVLVRCFAVGSTLFIDQEAYGVGVDIDKTPAMFAKIDRADKYTIRADSARPETISYMQAHGFPRMEAVHKWAGSVEDGIEFMRGFEKIVIHERCKHVADEFRLYSYKIHRLSGDILPEVEDKNNHCFVGDTMVLTDKGEVRIDHIKVGDNVLTRSGRRKVVRVWDNGIKQVEKFNVCGKGITSTADHKVITEEGKVGISEIDQNNTVFIWSSSRCKLLKTTNTKRSYLKAILTDVIQEAKEEATGFISRGPGLMENRRGCMSQYTSTIKGRYRKDVTYTTKMGIRSIMTSVISNPLLVVLTCLLTPLCSIKAIRNKSKDISRAYGAKQANGTEAKRGTHGIKTILQSRFMQRMFANNAEPNTQHSRNEPIGSVRISAKPERYEHVYDLMVEGQHEYIANRVLVSNCTDALRYALQPMIRNRSAAVFQNNFVR